MDLEEFERQVVAGEITDFEPYLKETGSIKQDLRNKKELKLIERT